MAKYFLLLGLLSVTSCQKEVLTIGSDTATIPLGLTVDVQEPAVNQRYTISLVPSPTGDFFDNLGAIGTVSAGALGPTLFMGLFTQSGAAPSEQQEEFNLQFWPEDFTANRAATPEEMAIFLAEGRTFPFGIGPGMVRFDLRLPVPTAGGQLSSSGYLPEPAGTLRVESIFPFESSIPGLTEAERNALMVRLSFSGEIGVFDEADFLTAQEEGNPYVAKELAILEGDVVLVLESTWR